MAELEPEPTKPTAADAKSATALYEVIDTLVAGFAAPSYAGELGRAREQYEARRGRVRQDEPLWEVWTQSFVEWFALEWADDTAPLPPAARALAGEADRRRAAAFRAWLSSQRALVQVMSLRAGRVRVRDLLGGALFEVTEPRRLYGVDRGDVAEVRLVGFEGVVRFGRTYLFHPSGSGPALSDRVAQLAARGLAGPDILDRCATLRLRSERYPHVDPIRLYRSTTDEP